MKVGGRWLAGTTPMAAIGAMLSTAPGLAVESGTPLMLKDGHISQVSVHIFDFQEDGEELTPDSRTALAELAADLRAGCFLTAQAIGHVEKPAEEGEAALIAHQLARARADTVQNMLVEAGLPPKAIASVWDWQFTITEPRVTLWTFSLDTDENCTEALASEVPPEALADPPPRTEVVEAPSEPPPVSAEEPSIVEEDVASEEVAEVEPVLDSEPTAGETVSRIKDPPETKEVVSVESEETVRQASVTPEDDVIPEEDEVAAPVPKPTAPPALEEAPETEISSLGEEASEPLDEKTSPVADEGIFTLETVAFDVNSSYFDAETGRALRAILQDLPENDTYTVALEAAVGTGDVQGAASPEESAKYHRWIAERRLQRVIDWLSANAGDRRLVIEENYVEADASRTVIVGIKPAE